MIGTNKKDATETVELLLDDARAGLLDAGRATVRPLEDLLTSAERRSSTTRAGRRSTPPSARPASRSAARG